MQILMFCAGETKYFGWSFLGNISAVSVLLTQDKGTKDPSFAFTLFLLGSIING